MVKCCLNIQLVVSDHPYLNSFSCFHANNDFIRIFFDHSVASNAKPKSHAAITVKYITMLVMLMAIPAVSTCFYSG